MNIEIAADPVEISREVSSRITSAIVQAVQEQLSPYASLGREIKKMAEESGRRLAAEVLADPAFQAEAKAALTRGILAGMEKRGAKIAQGMSLQRALSLAGAAGDAGTEGTR